VQAVYETILEKPKGGVMELRDYQMFANRTAKNLGFRDGLIHASLGLSGEAGEFADAVKRVAIYEGVADRANMVEELGDLLWYVAYACEVLGEPLEIVARENIEKLRKRYPEFYSDFHAHARMDKE
jgi:NTP pyrophosphatase (non-canonical NTP hydrolase)